MNSKTWPWTALSVILLLGCGSNANDSKTSATPTGALPCEGLAIDCRTAFADSYSGTYQGSATGTFTLNVDVLGGIQGTGPGIGNITGQVDEFGRVKFSFPDGTEFTGQFSADRHSIAGTWKGSAGTGSFVAQSLTVASGVGGAGGGVGGASASTPSASAIVAAAVQACQRASSCGTVAASSCSSITEPDLPVACWNEELAFYQCITASTCSNYQTACTAKGQATDDCLTDTSVGAGYPINPDFNPALTGIIAFDDVVHLCSQCTTAAKACYEAPDCKAFAECVQACPSNDFSCGDACETAHAAGFLTYSDAATCSFSNC